MKLSWLSCIADHIILSLGMQMTTSIASRRELKCWLPKSWAHTSCSAPSGEEVQVGMKHEDGCIVQAQGQNDTYTHTHNIYIYIQGVPHKAVAEVSTIVGCCDSRMAERSHWWTDRWLRSPLFLSLSLSFSDYLPTYLCIYLSIQSNIT